MLTVALSLWGCVAADRPESTVSSSTYLLDSAVKVKDRLVDQNFECIAKGRELYPILFECSGSDSLNGLGVFLYADDRGRLEGVRAFGPENTSWLPVTLSLIYDPVVTDSLFDLLQTSPAATSQIILDSTLLEWESESVPFILRISPLSAIRN